MRSRVMYNNAFVTSFFRKVDPVLPRQYKFERDLLVDGEAYMRIPTDAEIAAFTDLPKLRDAAAALLRILQIVEFGFDGVVGRSIRRTLALFEARIDELAVASSATTASTTPPAPKEPFE